MKATLDTFFWRKSSLLVATILAALAVASCESPQQSSAESNAHREHQSLSASDAEEIWVCPMHPHIQEHGPGTCPICGMDLVERVSSATSSSDDAAGSSVEVSAAAVSALGVRYFEVDRADISASVRVPAQVVADANAKVQVSVRVDAWAERLLVRAEGERVQAGQVIAQLYAPDWVRAQEEMLLGGDSADAARARLGRLGVADSDIQNVIETGKSSRRLPLRAPTSGIVRNLRAIEGARVSADMPLFEIESTSRVWIEARLLPGQLSSIGSAKLGHFSLRGDESAHWMAPASYVVPIADPVTQAISVRFAIRSSDAPPLGLWVDAHIEGPTRKNVLRVPVESVIRKSDGAFVIVQSTPTRFEVRKINLGARSGDYYGVRSGVSEGERIVRSGQFLLDSEADLRSGLARLSAEHAAHAGVEAQRDNDSETSSEHDHD